MAFTLRLGLLAATIQIAQGSRVSNHDMELLLTENEVAQGDKWGDEDPIDLEKNEDVDFSFMTENFRYPGHATGFFGTITEWFGGRSTSEDRKDELVEGHTCQKRGSREQTYYATSLCYWLPEISSKSTRYSMMYWRGGKYSKAKDLCGGMTGSGVCGKCSICHNNAIDEDGDVEYERFYEHLTLPDGCWGEKQIERACVDEYNNGNHGLKMEDGRCHEVEGRFNQATQELIRCTSALERLPRRIHQELPQEIQRAQQNIYRKEAQLDSAQHDERNKRQWMQGQCDSYSRLKHGLRWQNMFLGATPTEQLLDMMSFHCSWPRRPIDNKNGQYWDEMQRYNNQMRLYEACNQCENAKTQLKSANSRTSRARSTLRSAQGQVTRLQQEMYKAQQDLSMWQSRHSGLDAAKQAMDSEWLPQAHGCQETYSQYTNGKARHVSECAPTYYNASCEKACVEVQAQHAGCGVMEGDQPGSVNGNGGIQGTCAPPQPSWVMGPFTYGAKEATDDQCKRIDKVQSVRHAQKILKSGWLWKKGRGINGWDKRFFVLESADQVRSAVLRYFKKDPSTSADSDESVGKGIILWDAKGLKVKSGAQYGWKDGEECFKLYHFYRDFRLCVPKTEPNGIANVRDEWMDLLEVEMTHSKDLAQIEDLVEQQRGRLKEALDQASDTNRQVTREENALAHTKAALESAKRHSEEVDERKNELQKELEGLKGELTVATAESFRLGNLTLKLREDHRAKQGDLAEEEEEKLAKVGRTLDLQEGLLAEDQAALDKAAASAAAAEDAATLAEGSLAKQRQLLEESEAAVHMLQERIDEDTDAYENGMKQLADAIDAHKFASAQLLKSTPEIVHQHGLALLGFAAGGH